VPNLNDSRGILIKFMKIKNNKRKDLLILFLTKVHKINMKDNSNIRERERERERVEDCVHKYPTING